MQSTALNQYHAVNSDSVDWAFFDLMKSTAEIHANEHKLTEDCINQLLIVVNSLSSIIKRKEVFQG